MGHGNRSLHTLVLMNSSTAHAARAKEQLAAYLCHFGVPFSLLDLAFTGLPADIGTHHALVLLSHPMLACGDTGMRYRIRKALCAAVGQGCGIVSFDPGLLDNLGSPNSVECGVLEFADVRHYITRCHEKDRQLRLFSPLSTPDMLSGDATVLIRASDKPFLTAAQVGTGRVVQWGSMDWMHTRVLGPLAGLDDCLWRSMVWAARKPFVMHALPPIVTMRVDDTAGWGGFKNGTPLYWAHTAARFGFKPWMGLFIYNLSPQAIDELRGIVRSGKGTASPHALGRPCRGKDFRHYYFPNALPLRSGAYDEFIFYDHENARPWPDAEAKRGLRAVDEWYERHAPIPISKYLLAHWYELGSNTVPHAAQTWGAQFTGMTREVDLPAKDSTPWLRCGPFRLFEEPGTSTHPAHLRGNRPVYYADFMQAAGYKLFNCLTEIRDNAGYEWAPDNDVSATIERGVVQLRRALDSLALAVLFTHETDYIHAIEPDRWERILRGVAGGVSEYGARAAMLDEAFQVVRAYRTSRLESCSFDEESGTLQARLTGRTDVATQLHVFEEKDSLIERRFIEVPAFEGSVVVEAPAPRR